jgi:hypothetical protein
VSAGVLAARLLGGVVVGGAGGVAGVTGGVEHQVDQGVAAAGFQGALITGEPSVAGVFIQHGVHAEGVSGGEVGGQGGHPVGLGPSLFRTLRCRGQ